MDSLLDDNTLEKLIREKHDFRQRRPYPYSVIPGILKPEAFDILSKNLPDINLFEKQFGYQRAHGQQSHDRFSLQYRPAIKNDLPVPWIKFIDEIESDDYQRFWHEMFGLKPRERIIFTMHWHFAPSQASVSPHTDARRKLGSHIFYLNRPEEWDESWGGQTLVLDDEGKWPRHSAPDFGEIREVASSKVLDNQSFLFEQNDHSWHAVRPIKCPEDKLRKVFIVVGNRLNLQVFWRRVRGKDPDGYPIFK